MSRYQPYPNYKESGVEWLGRVPEHWEIKRNRFIFHFSKGLTITKENLQDDGVPCISYGEVHSKYGFEFNPRSNALKCVSEDYLRSSKNCLLHKGDFVFADTSEDYEGAGNFSYLNEDFQTFAGYHTIIARASSDVNPRFCAFVFDSAAHRAQIQTAAKGIKVFSISQAILKDASSWFPPLTEQTAIAEFLDRETAKIDTLIAKQERMIDLLNEKRSALISHAVTKGLNPDVLMKDSGVEWLGEVPEHWEAKSLKYIAKLNPPKSEIQKLKQQECSFVPMEKLKTGSIELDVTKQINEVYEGYTYFQNNDVLLAKVTPCFENRNIAIASDLLNGIGFGSSEIYVVRAFNHVDRKYLYYVLQEDTFMKLGISQMTGTGGLKRVPSEFLNNVKLPFPDIFEQTSIADFLDIKTAKIDTLIAKARQAIELMKERRTALISAAVTGKIDVRGMA